MKQLIGLASNFKELIMSTRIKEMEGVPAIYNFHIDEFKNVETDADIEEFEMLMKNSAKITKFDFSKENIIAFGSTSCSGGRADDCDEIQR